MKNVLEYLERDALLFPDKTAFADVKNSVTYGELLQTARRIGTACAAYTRTRRPVVVLSEKSVETVSVFFGIVYAGCFYVCLDLKHPLERLEKILAELQPSLIVYDAAGKRVADKLPGEAAMVPFEDLMAAEADEELLGMIRREMIDVDPLYANFTSGSTGQPKGVLIPHRSVIDFIEVFCDTFGLTGNDVFGNQAPFDFDVSVKDIYSGLRLGARVELLPRMFFSFPAKLLDHLSARGVTVLIWAVSALCIVSTLKALSHRVPESLRAIMFSGEIMPIKHLNYWRSYYPDAMFVNLYGPTEITCNCTYHILDRAYEEGELLPVGRHFDNEKVFLLDERDALIEEPGILGEICVSGTAVGLGYLNDPEHTKANFVQNPLNGLWLETIYRTGDLGMYDDEGLLYFKARKDFQIKHQGHRIELQEVELAMDAVENVDRCVCLFDEEKDLLIAVYEGAADEKSITRSLRTVLPAIMIPNLFYRTEALPVTKNGKIDRKTLKNVYITEKNEVLS